MAESQMKLKRYVVNEFFYVLNEDFDFKSQRVIKIDPCFKRDIINHDKNQFTIRLNVAIDNSGNEFPFSANIMISGTFLLENWQNENNMNLVKNNATAILFPFLRTLLYTITMNANVPPYVLPVMNIVELFKEIEKDHETS